VISHVGTLGELIERWLEAITPERSAYTIRGCRRLVKRAIGPALMGHPARQGDGPLNKVTGRSTR
jgi:hypothetical protein